MALPDPDGLDALPLSELRGLVADLIGQVRALADENRALRDEVARLKGLPPSPPTRSTPSGMERASERAQAKQGQRQRGPVHERIVITREVVLKAAVPAGSRFKGYEDVVVRDLVLEAVVIRYRRERWSTPSGMRVVAALPPGIVGGFGPHLRRFLLAAHVQGQVTSERLTALLSGLGLMISKRQVVRLLSGPLDPFVAEEQAVLRAGLASAAWISVDDTAARHGRTDGVTTRIGDARFTAFRTTASKSRLNFLALLRAGHGDFVVNAAALAYMRTRALAGPFLAALAAHPVKVFADPPAWQAHLTALGFDARAVTPDPVQVATEGALWGAVRHHGLMPDTVVVSDGAGQFRVGLHALCWAHAGRLVHALIPTTAAQRKAIALTRTLIWWFYAYLKAWARAPVQSGPGRCVLSSVPAFVMAEDAPGRARSATRLPLSLTVVVCAGRVVPVKVVQASFVSRAPRLRWLSPRSSMRCAV